MSTVRDDRRAQGVQADGTLLVGAWTQHLQQGAYELLPQLLADHTTCLLQLSWIFMNISNVLMHYYLVSIIIYMESCFSSCCLFVLNISSITLGMSSDYYGSIIITSSLYYFNEFNLQKFNLWYACTYFIKFVFFKHKSSFTQCFFHGICSLGDQEGVTTQLSKPQ